MKKKKEIRGSKNEIGEKPKNIGENVGTKSKNPKNGRKKKKRKKKRPPRSTSRDGSKNWFCLKKATRNRAAIEVKNMKNPKKSKKKKKKKTKPWTLKVALRPSSGLLVCSPTYLGGARKRLFRPLLSPRSPPLQTLQTLSSLPRLPDQKCVCLCLGVGPLSPNPRNHKFDKNQWFFHKNWPTFYWIPVKPLLFHTCQQSCLKANVFSQKLTDFLLNTRKTITFLHTCQQLPLLKSQWFFTKIDRLSTEYP